MTGACPREARSPNRSTPKPTDRFGPQPRHDSGVDAPNRSASDPHLDTFDGQSLRICSGVRDHPRIIGQAAHGLSGDVSWAVNDGAAKFGADAELKTAQLLNDIAMREDGPTVFHDLRIPIPNFNANLDHIVVSGTTLLIVDTKAWKAGFLWTFAGRTHRGLKRFVACDKQTVAMGHDTLVNYLARRNQTVRMAQPLVVVWPTGNAAPTTWAARFPGAKIVSPGCLSRLVGRMHGPADPGLQQALTQLVNGRRVRAAAAAGPYDVGRF